MDRDQLRLYRTLCVLGAIAYSLVWLARWRNPALYDPYWQRGVLSALALSLVWFSFLNHWVQTRLYMLCCTLCYLATFHNLFLTAQNQFRPNYAMGFFTILLILGLVFQTSRGLLGFFLFSFCCAATASWLWSEHHAIGAGMYTVYLGIFLTIAFLVLHSRLLKEARLRDAYNQNQQQSSQLHQAHEEIERFQQRVAQVQFSERHFLGNVSHELRTPLALIQGYCEILQEEVASIKPETSEIIKEINVASDTLVHQIDSLLSLHDPELEKIQTMTQGSLDPHKTLLLVEDNHPMQKMISLRLERYGYSLWVAGDGQQALALLQNQTPTLILMDLALPDIDGLTLIRKIRQTAAWRDIPVIVLTAHALVGVKEDAFAAGCDEYETKPINFPRLCEKIEKLTQTVPVPG